MNRSWTFPCRAHNFMTRDVECFGSIHDDDQSDLVVHILNCAAVPPSLDLDPFC